MSRPESWAALVAALALTLLPGCGASTSDYIPNSSTARDDLTTALTSWQKGGKPSQLLTGEHPIYMVDSQWENGQVLESFEIVEDTPSTSPTEKWYKVLLKMKKPSGEKRVGYVAVGREPMWIFRDEDYEKQGSMGETPRANPNTRTPVRGR